MSCEKQFSNDKNTMQNILVTVFYKTVARCRFCSCNSFFCSQLSEAITELSSSEILWLSYTNSGIFIDYGLLYYK